MDVTTVKVLLLAVIGLLILAIMYGEVRPRRRAARARGETRWLR